MVNPRAISTRSARRMAATRCAGRSRPRRSSSTAAWIGKGPLSTSTPRTSSPTCRPQCSTSRTTLRRASMPTAPRRRTSWPRATRPISWLARLRSGRPTRTPSGKSRPASGRSGSTLRTTRTAAEWARITTSAVSRSPTSAPRWLPSRIRERFAGRLSPLPEPWTRCCPSTITRARTRARSQPHRSTGATTMMMIATASVERIACTKSRMATTLRPTRRSSRNSS